MRFSEDVRRQFPGLAETFDETEAFAKRYEAALAQRFTPSRRSRQEDFSLRDQAGLLRLSIVHRARLLTLTQIHCTNGGLVPGVMLAVRAHFEMTGLLAFFFRQSERYFAREIDGNEFAALLFRLHLGRRHGLDSPPSGFAPEEVEAVGVMTCVDDVDRLLKAEPTLKGAFRDSYEWLSEFCHPNGYGRSIGQRITADADAIEFDDGFEEEIVRLALGYGALSQQLFFDDLHEDVMKAIAQLPERTNV